MRGGGSPDEMLARLQSALPNPAALVLAQQDSAALGLTPDQVRRLQLERDSLDTRMADRIERLRTVLDALGQAGQPQRLLEGVRPIFAEAREDVVAVHTAVRQVLSPAQWNRLPERIRNLQMRIPGAGRPGR